jgi:predicted membrane protein
MIGFLGAFFGLINFLGEYASTINDLLLIIIIGQIIGSTFGYLATADYAKEQQSE